MDSPRRFRTDFRLCLPLLGVAAVLEAIAIAFAVFALMSRPAEATAAALPASACLLVLSALLTWACVVVARIALKDTYAEILVDDLKIAFRRSKRDYSEMPWSEVRNVVTSPAAVEIVGSEGRAMMVTANLLDFDAFQQLAEEKWDSLRYEAKERRGASRPDMVPFGSADE